MSDTPVSPSSNSDASRADRRARLRRRLTGGIFTALLAVQGIGAELAQANTSPVAGDGSTGTSVTARAEQLRAQMPTDDQSPGLAWGNGWFNWSNGWHNWKNNWNNWHNNWNNWNNWQNGWYNI